MHTHVCVHTPANTCMLHVCMCECIYTHTHICKYFTYYSNIQTGQKEKLLQDRPRLQFRNIQELAQINRENSGQEADNSKEGKTMRLCVLRDANSIDMAWVYPHPNLTSISPCVKVKIIESWGKFPPYYFFF